jgi:hypothetical protein
MHSIEPKPLSVLKWLLQTLEGVAVGSLISGFVAEIFFPYCEDLLVKHVIETETVILYNGFFDDILIIFGDREITATY